MGKDPDHSLGFDAPDARGREVFHLRRRVHHLARQADSWRQALANARREARRYRTVADATFDWEMWISPDWDLEYVSPSCQRITGVAPDKLGRDARAFLDLVDSGDRPMVTRVLKQGLDQARTVTADFCVGHADKGSRMVSMACEPVTGPGGADLGLRCSIRDVTSRIRDEEQFREIFQNAPLGMFRSTVSGRFLTVNRTLARMLGYASPEEVLADIRDIAGQIYADPGRRPEIVAQMRANPDLARFENTYRRRDGSVFTAFLHVRVVREPDGSPLYVEGLVEDITEKKRVARELDRARSLLAAVFAASPEPVLVLDSSLAVVMSNRDPGQAGGGLPQGSPDCGRCAASGSFLCDPCPAREALDTGRCAESEHADQAGGRHWRIRAHPVPGAPGPGELVAVHLHDVTEEKQLQALQRDMERMTRHDLKTPLMAVTGLPRLLRNDANLTDRQREVLDMIGGSGQRMIRMIDLWQGIYALETGEYSLDPRDVDLALVARHIREELADILSSLDVELVITVHGRPVAGDDSFMVRGEELLLYSMLANLVKNAVEASPRGQRVDLDFRRAAAAWEAVIHNQGAIAQEIRPVFFDKYATCGKKHGLGLGAYSARLMATAHGGDIAFTTDEASGTTLTVRIPRDPPVKPA